jgi:hypothetical protein
MLVLFFVLDSFPCLRTYQLTSLLTNQPINYIFTYELISYIRFLSLLTNLSTYELISYFSICANLPAQLNACHVKCEAYLTVA